MFDMTGHKIEITGLRSPSPRDEKILEDTGTDVSDWIQVKKLVERTGEYDLLNAQEVSMVVWGEDLARIPLLVFDNDGNRIGREESIPLGCLEHYEQAAKMVNMAMGAEQQLAQEGHGSRPEEKS